MCNKPRCHKPTESGEMAYADNINEENNYTSNHDFREGNKCYGMKTERRQPGAFRKDCPEATVKFFLLKFPVNLGLKEQ